MKPYDWIGDLLSTYSTKPVILVEGEDDIPLESGRFSRGNTMGTSEAGFVMLGNITLDEQHRPVHEEDGIFREIPNFLQETAFIDRIHGLIAGWEMGRVTKDTPS